MPKPLYRPPYHIAFVITRFARGGMETRLADVVNRLDKSRWNPHVYTFYDHETLQNLIEPSRLHTPISKGRTDLLVPFRLAQIFRREKTVIVWSMAQGLAAAWGRLGAVLGGVPARVLSIHDNYPLAPITRLLNPWTDIIVPNSQRSADTIQAQGIPANKLHVIYNGVDTGIYSAGKDRRADLFRIPANRPVILNVGRLFYEKGRDVMIRAAVPLVRRENPPLIVFVGEGVLRKELEMLASNFGISQHIRFYDNRDDVPDLMRSSDIVVMSSRDVPFGESCPNVVLEGMATGLPVVGTRVGGTAELIVNNETGFVIPPDDHETLSQKLRQLLDDPTLQKRMGVAGRQRIVDHFSIQRMIAEREALFEQLLESKRLLVLDKQPEGN